MHIYRKSHYPKWELGNESPTFFIQHDMDDILVSLEDVLSFISDNKPKQYKETSAKGTLAMSRRSLAALATMGVALSESGHCFSLEPHSIY